MLKSWEKLDDHEAKAEIQNLKGFGNWSSDIVLLFYLGRKNIFPFGDATLNKAVIKLYNQDISKDLSFLDWARPYRGILALYLWKWVDNGMTDIKK